MRSKRVRRVGQVAVSALLALVLVPLARPVALAVLGSDRLVLGALELVYDLPSAPTPPVDTVPTLALARARVSGTVDARFLSVAIDTSEVVGGRWWSRDGHVELLVGSTRVAPFDFQRARLARLAGALAPAYLRIGGTVADSVRYRFGAESPSTTSGTSGAHDPSAPILERSHWDAVNRFATNTGLSLMFTANAGPLARDAQGNWHPGALEPLLHYSAAQGYDVPVWELGNEVNAFAVTHGLSARVSARRYAADVRTFAATVHRHYPSAQVAAGAVFAWPVMGETPGGFSADFLAQGQPAADIFTWHFYPQQSRRCLTATRRASPTTLLEPGFLNEFQMLAGHFSRLADRPRGGPALWVGETGNAQCGGEPGVSDRFASSLWWLDQLGSAARAGQQVVVRQTLAGSHYGLLDPDTLTPRPDYWASVLWKRTMGGRVVALPSEGDNPHLRVYGHCHPAADGRVSVLAINLRSDRALSLRLQASPDSPGQPLTGKVFAVQAAGLQAAEVSLNGGRLQLADDGSLPPLEGATQEMDQVQLSPLSYTFIVPDAPQPACLAGAPAQLTVRP